MKKFEITYIQGDVINKKMIVQAETISKALIMFTLVYAVEMTDISAVVEVV